MEPTTFFADSNSIDWQSSPMSDGVEFKTLCSANDRVMEMYRFQPNTSYPDHIHAGPEFVYLIEGSARQNGQWISAGWSSVGETNSKDLDFLSGENGCTFITVYTASHYID